MAVKSISIEIFGADIICASCINAPSSKDTYEWLQAAISRKFPNQPYQIEYIDINYIHLTDNRQVEIAKQVLSGEFFYPLIIINKKVIGEGHVSLKPIFNEFEKNGYIAGQK